MKRVRWGDGEEITECGGGRLDHQLGGAVTRPASDLDRMSVYRLSSLVELIEPSPPTSPPTIGHFTPRPAVTPARPGAVQQFATVRGRRLPALPGSAVRTPARLPGTAARPAVSSPGLADSAAAGRTRLLDNVNTFL